MRHQVRGRKLNRTKSHRDAMFSNMATSLFEHKKIHTTEAKAKELRPFAESLITKAKKALAREKQNLLPEGHTIDIHNRRLVGRVIRSKAVLQEVFDAIAPTVEARNGGYTRIIKTGIRYGDAGRKAIIELVDWSAPQDGVISLKRKKKKTNKKKVTASAKNKIAESKVAEQQEVEQSNEEVVVTEHTVEELKEENSIESNDADNTDAETKDNEKNAETNTNN
jgi:large subunit ribosomal protein L17